MRMPHSVMAVLVVACVIAAAPASAQQPAQRFEVSAQAAVLRLSDFGATSAGVGGRVTFDLTRWASIEGEATFFPDDNVLLPVGDGISPALTLRIAHNRRRADAFLGVKLGVRGNRFGAFAKVRPGFARLTDRGQSCVGEVCALAQMLLVRPEYRSEFALDFGGVVEFYPSRRLTTRVELGDTVIRHRSFAPPCWMSECTSHNLTTKMGVGYRF